MISPLGQRQVHQTSHLEAVRAANDASELVQREAAKKRAADDRVAEAQASVPEIPGAAPLRTEERKGRQQQGRQEADRKEHEATEDTETLPSGSAIVADGHLDFLA